MFKIEVDFAHESNGSMSSGISIDKAQRLVLTELARRFGGATLVATQGSYVHHSTGLLVIEKGSQITSYTEIEVSQFAMDAIHQVAREVAAMLDQESVLVTVQHVTGSLEFVA